MAGKLTLQTTLPLVNLSYKIPALGFGVYQVSILLDYRIVKLIVLVPW